MFSIVFSLCFLFPRFLILLSWFINFLFLCCVFFLLVLPLLTIEYGLWTSFQNISWAEKRQRKKTGKRKKEKGKVTVYFLCCWIFYSFVILFSLALPLSTIEDVLSTSIQNIYLFFLNFNVFMLYFILKSKNFLHVFCCLRMANLIFKTIVNENTCYA